MTDNRLLDLVDAADFRTLFIDELGWSNPDSRNNVEVDVDGEKCTVTPVAQYRGLRIWHCAGIPARPIQRAVDRQIGLSNHERLVIFTEAHRQEWRWPRRARLGGANAKLVVHDHIVGDRRTHLIDRLRAIEIGIDEDPTLIEILDRMRDAFDTEAEAASLAAARLMGTLYAELDRAGVDQHTATLLLARLLFLMFGDDTEMWQPAPPDLFEKFLRDHTSPETLHRDLTALFRVLDTAKLVRDPLNPGDVVRQFPYINGGLFSGELALPQLPTQFYTELLDACVFDWSVISPAVFGSMFQTVKDKKARGEKGEHYTTEENIKKTIGPLFLDEYWSKYQAAQNDKGRLTKLHNELGRLRFIDPACGCGNFLIVAYRELRALELEILKRRRDLDLASGSPTTRSQLSLDVTADLKVSLDQFYGIEIEEWPAKIAETAMLLVDHLANQQMAEEFGMSPTRLPIEIAPTIHHGNALQLDWAELFTPDDFTYVFGNPPFRGDNRSKEQKADLQHAWGAHTQLSRLDYVTAWHATTLRFLAGSRGQWAFVTTNSIVQGDQPARLFAPIFEAGWIIKFAHRTFAWRTEAKDGAAVHCVIVGFTRDTTTRPTLFEYSTPDSQPRTLTATSINPYLMDYPFFIVKKASKPLNRHLPGARKGSEAADGGGLLINAAQYPDFAADPVTAKYLRPFRGARELLYNEQRWCLWMTNFDPSDYDRSVLLRQRIDVVQHARVTSDSEEVAKSAATPHLFRIIKQPNVAYVCIPRHVSERREYYTVARYPADVICGDHNFLAPDPTGVLFAVISSSMFITWQRTVGGCLESRLRFASTLTWNTLPLPELTDDELDHLRSAGAGVLAARDALGNPSLAKLYDPDLMAPALRDAHNHLDDVVDRAFGASARCETPLQRQKLLFEQYRRVVLT